MAGPNIAKELQEMRKRHGAHSQGAQTLQGNMVATLDDMDLTRAKPAELRQVAQDLGTFSSKLQEANSFGDQMAQELRDLCLGLETKLQEIGYAVSEAYRFKGFKEKSLAFLGGMGLSMATNAAQRLRIQRLQTQSVKELVQEVQQLILETIQELGEQEAQYIQDIGEVSRDGKAGSGYNFTLRQVLEKLRNYQPQFKAFKEKREALEAEIKTRRMELESGVVTDDEHPEKERELEEVQKDFQNALLHETEFLTVIQEAQRALPEVQKSRDAAQQAVQAIRQMRRGLLEKSQNFKTVLENAMTAVIAKAKLERYQNMDPATNKTIQLVTENNIKTAAAAVEVALTRAAKAAIDPTASARLQEELMRSINGYLEGIAKLEEAAASGNRPAGADSPASANGAPKVGGGV